MSQYNKKFSSHNSYSYRNNNFNDDNLYGLNLHDCVKIAQSGMDPGMKKWALHKCVAMVVW